MRKETIQMYFLRHFVFRVSDHVSIKKSRTNVFQHRSQQLTIIDTLTLTICLSLSHPSPQGDLAKKKIYPTLWWLFRDNLLPKRTRIVGYARTAHTVAELRAKCAPYMKATADEAAEGGRLDEFWTRNEYVAGGYDTRRDFELLDREIGKHEAGAGPANRLFYLALPPSVFQTVTAHVRTACMGTKGWTRVIVEKPFGRDAASSKVLSDHLAALFSEEQLYRIDHYLGKEMVQNLMTLRFGNRIFSPTWCREHVASVLITFKEPFGTQGE